MGELSIFKSQEVVTKERGKSKLASKLASASGTRRIQCNTNGTFKRIVNGDVIGKALRGELNVIVVNALEKVSRTFYEKSYDPDAEPTLPNCWSNLGDIPEKGAKDKQADSCLDCPQNIAGSGKGNSRACRFNRRIAVIVEGDTTGDIYQFNVPAKSLFGKGDGNVHPFESYVRFLSANGMGIDQVITQISYNDDAETMELQFTPLRETSEEEDELVLRAQAQPEAEAYVKLTVAQTDGVTKQPTPSKPTADADADADEDEEVEEPPKKRSKGKAKESAPEQKELSDVVNEWAD